MPRDRRRGIEEEAERVADARCHMALTRHVTFQGRRLLATVFAVRGVGDWERATRPGRSIAFACRLCRSPASLEAFRRLALLVEAHAGRLLYRPCPDRQPDYVLPLQRLAEAHAAWQRGPESWKPRGSDAGRQFAQLTAHLLPAAALAPFRQATFFVEPSRQIEDWFGQLGHRRPGDGWGVPLPLTKRMGYYLLLARLARDPLRALRWAQARALGASEALARAVSHTRLGSQLWEDEEERWWLGVIHWLVNHPELDLMDAAPVVDYLADRRYGEPEREQPPDPSFSLPGRTPAALLRLVEGWHGAAREAEQRAQEFRPSGLRPGRWETHAEGNRSVWTMRELLAARAIQDEGQAMRHCVALFSESVALGRYAIWSLRVNRGGVTRRALTVRVDLRTHAVVEGRGRCNRPPKREERRLLAAWAAENRLVLRVPSEEEPEA